MYIDHVDFRMCQEACDSRSNLFAGDAGLPASLRPHPHPPTHCATCCSKGLEPHVTLHHFVHPAWFERLGGFTKEGEDKVQVQGVCCFAPRPSCCPMPSWLALMCPLATENIPYFLDYAQTAFRLFGKHAKYWATFNEPGKQARRRRAAQGLLAWSRDTAQTVLFGCWSLNSDHGPPRSCAGVTSFAGHIYGSFPPGRIGQVAGCARQMLLMLRSHAQAYEVLKAMPGEWARPVCT